MLAGPSGAEAHDTVIAATAPGRHGSLARRQQRRALPRLGATAECESLLELLPRTMSASPVLALGELEYTRCMSTLERCSIGAALLLDA